MSTSTKLYRLTEKELGALAATAESCMIVGEGLEDEAEEALAAVNDVKTRAKSGSTRGKICLLAISAKSINPFHVK